MPGFARQRPDMVATAPHAALGAALAYEPIEARRATTATTRIITTTVTHAQPAPHSRPHALTSGLIERRVTVENAAEEEVQLTGVRLVPAFCRGADQCLFDAPGNVAPARAAESPRASRRDGSPAVL